MPSEEAVAGFSLCGFFGLCGIFLFYTKDLSDVGPLTPRAKIIYTFGTLLVFVGQLRHGIQQLQCCDWAHLGPKLKVPDSMSTFFSNGSNSKLKISEAYLHEKIFEITIIRLTMSEIKTIIYYPGFYSSLIYQNWGNGSDVKITPNLLQNSNFLLILESWINFVSILFILMKFSIKFETLAISSSFLSQRAVKA